MSLFKRVQCILTNNFIFANEVLEICTLVLVVDGSKYFYRVLFCFTLNIAKR